MSVPEAQNGPMQVALALGSGGARGYAHIGVVDELQARGHEVVGVAGSSMGALVGGVLAAGKLDEFSDWARSLTQRAVLMLMDPALNAAGVLRAEKVLDAVRGILGPVQIEDLDIPYTAVATDLITGRSVWLQRGPVDDAIRASIAIPGVISPHILDGRLLGDGGILDPIPMAPIAAVRADVTIAVTFAGNGPEDPADQQPNRTTDWWNRVWRNTSASLLDTKAARSLRETTTGRALLSRLTPDEDLGEPGSAETEPAEAEPAETEPDDAAAAPRLGGFEVMNRSFDIAQAALARHTLAAYPPDLLIEVPRTVCRSLEFYRAEEVIAVGRAYAADALDAFEAQNAAADG